MGDVGIETKTAIVETDGKTENNHNEGGGEGAVVAPLVEDWGRQ